MNTIINFIKKETIFFISIILAIISMFFVHPDISYLDYIDWNTLLLLFSLMAVMAGYKRLGVFRLIGVKLLSGTRSTRQLILILTILPFLFSMLITNDVALITFVPFAIIVLKLAAKEELIITVVVLQTLAANLGSMLTPMGNPQNLYLYAASGLSPIEFLKLMLPYTLIAAIAIILCCLLHKNRPIDTIDTTALSASEPISKTSVILYGIAFFLCLLSVSDVIHPIIMALIICIFLLLYDKAVFIDIDYTLLGTFIGFFIFIGNMQRLPEFQQLIRKIIDSHEVIVSIVSSQVISNVPTALLLSGFTDRYSLLIIGTNLGGLGTLIASMASLISYKQIAREYPDERNSYLIKFTMANILMLGLLLLFFFARNMS